MKPETCRSPGYLLIPAFLCLPCYFAPHFTHIFSFLRPSESSLLLPASIIAILGFNKQAVTDRRSVFEDTPIRINILY